MNKLKEKLIYKIKNDMFEINNLKKLLLNIIIKVI